MLRLGRCRAESLDAAGDVPQRRFLERLGGSYGHGCAACERQQGSRPQGGAGGMAWRSRVPAFECMFFYHPNIGSTWMIISVRISGFEDPELAHIMDGAQKVGWGGFGRAGITPGIKVVVHHHSQYYILVSSCIIVYPSIVCYMCCFWRAGKSGVATRCSCQNIGKTLKAAWNFMFLGSTVTLPEVNYVVPLGGLDLCWFSSVPFPLPVCVWKGYPHDTPWFLEISCNCSKCEVVLVDIHPLISWYVQVLCSIKNDGEHNVQPSHFIQIAAFQELLQLIYSTKGSLQCLRVVRARMGQVLTRCALVLPPAPPHPLLFFNRLPLLPTLFPFFQKHRFNESFLWVHLLLLNLS